MENRHLPILHKTILLCGLCVSNELRSFWSEWAVRTHYDAEKFSKIFSKEHQDFETFQIEVSTYSPLECQVCPGPFSQNSGSFRICLWRPSRR